MKFTIKVNNKPYEIEVRAQQHERTPSSVKINGRTHTVLVGEDWSSQYPRQFIVGNSSHEVEFEYGEDGFPKRVQLDGIPAEIQVDFLGKARLSKVKMSPFTGGKANAIVSPMPGKIVRIEVSEGQKVKQGQVCIVLEAMKMENELEAQKSGVIRKIHVRLGQLVDIDEVIISFEDEDEMFF